MRQTSRDREGAVAAEYATELLKQCTKFENGGNEMNIPGFTAEASLVEAGPYYTAAGYDQSSGVQPAFPRRGPCGCDFGDSDCIECCFCVRRGGHPRTCCM
jgi:hypothetical protein